jgi:hypothetical protein
VPAEAPPPAPPAPQAAPAPEQTPAASAPADQPGAGNAGPGTTGSTDVGAAPETPKPRILHAGGTMGGGASNLTPADTRSEIAPKLPSPAVDPNAGPEAYLMAAQKALKAHRTGQAQAALEMAETRALDRSTPADQADTPDSSPMVTNIQAALTSLGNKDTAGAERAIDQALGGQGSGGQGSEGQMGDMKMGHPMHHRSMGNQGQPASPPAQ